MGGGTLGAKTNAPPPRDPRLQTHALALHLSPLSPAAAVGDDAAVAALAEGLADGAPPDRQRDAAERLRDLLLDQPQVCRVRR